MPRENEPESLFNLKNFYQPNDSTYQVTIDQFAILTADKRCFLFMIVDNECIFSHFLNGIDYLYSDGISSCLGIYAFEAQKEVVCIAHLSVSCGLLANRLEDIAIRMRATCDLDIDNEFSIKFLLFGCSPNTLDELTNNTRVILPPKNCSIDSYPRLMNRDTIEEEEEFGDEECSDQVEIYEQNRKDDVLAIFQHTESLMVEKYDALLDETKLYKQRLDAEIQLEEISTSNENMEINLNEANSPSPTNSNRRKRSKTSISDQNKVLANPMPHSPSRLFKQRSDIKKDPSLKGSQCLKRF